MSTTSVQDSVGLKQNITLEQGTNKTFLVISLLYRMDMINSSGSCVLEFWDNTGIQIGSRLNLINFPRRGPWQYKREVVRIRSGTNNVSLDFFLWNAIGTIELANIIVEQVDVVIDPILSITPTGKWSIQLKWNLANNRTDVANYTIYRDIGVYKPLNQSNYLVSFPTQTIYGINIYESSYQDHAVRLLETYTYQVLAFHANGTLLDRTYLEIGQATLVNDYFVDSMLIAFPRTNDIHLCWRLKATSTASIITLYNGIDKMSNIGTSRAQLIGTYPVAEMKTIVPLSYRGPYLLVTNGGNDFATAKLLNLTHPQFAFTQDHINTIRQQVQQQRGVRNTIFQHGVSPIIPPPTSFPWPDAQSQHAAFGYVITGNRSFIDTVYPALMYMRQNYSIHDGSSVKLEFGTKTSARSVAFDWSYYGLSVQQRNELIKDFQYAAAVFSNYDDDHSNHNDDKASNWVAIVKSGELVLHFIAYNEDDYPNDLAERRIIFLLNEIRLHIDHSYGSSGYMQEGMGYLGYTSRTFLPAVYHANDIGLPILYETLAQKDWINFVLHTFSLRDDGTSVQFGVGTIYYYNGGLIPLLFGHTNDTKQIAALQWFFDHLVGANSTVKTFDTNNFLWTKLYYPFEVRAEHPSVAFPRSTTMLIDARDGFYAFRNRYRDRNDVLVAFENNHRKRRGWVQKQTLGLSIMSHDTIWTQMPAKNATNLSLFSTSIIDGILRAPIEHGGYQKQAIPFASQGGGYVSLDASGHFQIKFSQRDIFVDMIKRDNTETLIAIYDQFNDNVSHAYTWQLSTTSEVRRINIGYENDLSTFIFIGRNNSWLKGWLYESQGVNFTTNNNLLQVNRIGFNASFKIVLAIGNDTPPIGHSTSKGINISDACIEFDALFQGPKCPLIDNTTESVTNESKPSNATIAIVAGVLGGFVLLATIVIGLIFLRKKLRNKTRINVFQEKSLKPKQTSLPPLKLSVPKTSTNKIKMTKINIIK